MSSSRSAFVLCTLLLFIALSALPVAAQSTDFSWTEGPTTVDLGENLAQIDLGEAYLFAGAEDTRQIMEQIGNPTDGSEVGMIVPRAEGQDWFLLFEHKPIGYVPDKEKDQLDADAILTSIKEGTKESNKIRAERGIAPLHIIGWYEEPHYDEQSHNLTWTILADSEEEGKTYQLVNYNTRLLGRTGYMSVVLVADPEELKGLLPEVHEILGGFSYKQGKRYAEYVQGDKLAQIGLTALIAGGAGAAVVQTGLLKTLAKFGKALILGILAVLGAIWHGIKSLFGGKDKYAVDPQQTNNLH
ncbi:MAG: DUF2167 domain-containing protein [Caldilineaceae bacterium]